VLLIDLDTQGHCSVGLDVAPGKDAPTVHDLFLFRDFLLADAIYPTAWPNLHLCPANPMFEHCSGTGEQTRLAEALEDEGLTGRYDNALSKTYVMQEQRTTHDAVLGKAGSFAGASSLKIMFF